MPGHKNPSHLNNMRRFAGNAISQAPTAAPVAAAPMAKPAFTSAPAPMPAKMPMAAMKKVKGC
jgi:hypothetical protein